MLSLLALPLLSIGINGQPKADNVTNLPGINFNLNYQQYSGYLDLSNGHHLHYWLQLAQGKPYPNDEPVVLWLNGGPGCSSLDGLIYEQGAIHVTDNGTLYENDYAWNKVANMIFMEAPVCVGFSYADSGECSMNDNTTADDNYHALLAFFTKFPELSKNDFYVTGESYGGVYVPTLTRRIIEGNQKSEGATINLKAFAVGNGLSSDALNTDSSVWFAYHHGIVGETQWNALMENCCESPYTRKSCPFSASKNKQCTAEVDAVMDVIYGGQLNWYNIYGDCLETTADGLSVEPKFSYAKLIHELTWLHKDFHARNGYKYITQMQDSLVGENVPCLDTTGADIYLNRADVKAALHISSKVNTKWAICSSTLKYEGIYDDLTQVYEDIFRMDPKVYATVYNGDTDLSCNFLGDEWFVDDLNLTATDSFKEWYYESPEQGRQVGGWTKDFDKLAFVTVRGSGHMVPQYRPVPALKMFEYFLQHKPLS